MPVELDQQVVEPVLFGEPPHFCQEIVAQGAADAAIGHLDQLFIGPGQIGTPVAYQCGVDVHLAHVVDDDGNPASVAVVQDMIEKCGLAGA
ncbi:hypothetical protein MAUB1S_07428 [Mycolicibacterium aubagnense]